MSNCSECYPDPPPSWREAPMNEEIRKNLKPQRYANIYHLTLYDALKAWGEEIETEYT